MTAGTALETLFGYDVISSEGNKVGSVDGVWADDATNEAEFIGVKTGWLMGKTHIIPMTDAQIGNGSITIPYTESQVKDAPSFGTDQEISPYEEDEIYSYYGIQRSTAQSPTGLPGGDTGQQYTDQEYSGQQYLGQQYETSTGDYAPTSDQGNQADMTLSEEQLEVGKREVEAGRVRLRKVVRTEHREVPVDLRREEVEIERVPAGQAGTPSDAFQEEEVEVPLMREEPVVAKEARVTGGVRVNKDMTTDTRTVGGEVRKEDVEVDRDVDTDIAADDRSF